ncbi:MAG: Smr/MutS family protein [Myxococcales bacterium]|nr:Smr/MutS family protein [Myxococcales bacterium]MCB9519876.1 Smr/MutS family protein [Myxococcales bacterium]MCB9532325.1 Smr/MutS family protein [Myxococcales bacterium]MCB9533217.1 Smr/MutS family protein [Myxococcales bacterium]
MAEKLAPLAKGLAKERKRAAADARRAVVEAPRPTPTVAPRQRMTLEEAMEAAFNAAGPDAAASKYLGEGFRLDADIVEPVRSEPAANVAPETTGEALSGDDLEFLVAMAGKVERQRSTELEEKAWAGATWRTEAQLASLTAAELHTLDLTGAQRDLLRRARKTQTPELNVRHLRRHEAIADVQAFVTAQYATSTRFVRIIHGKGRQSVGDAVLKPALVRWCEDEGSRWVRAWAPEIDATGQFGSLVAELRR